MGLTNLETRLSQPEANPQIAHSPRNPRRRFAGIHADEDIVLRVERPNLAVATSVWLFSLASRFSALLLALVRKGQDESSIPFASSSRPVAITLCQSVRR